MCRPDSSEKLRSAGTNTSSTTKSWLPVPRRPLVSQVSMMRISDTWNSMQRTSGAPLGKTSPLTSVPPMHQVECWQPLANAQRPLARNPPATGTALPSGAATPHEVTSSGPYTARATSSDRKPHIRPEEAPIMAHHPAEPSARESSSSTATIVASDASAPPYARGTSSLNTPERTSVSITAGGSRRPASISAAHGAISAAARRARSTSWESILDVT